MSWRDFFKSSHTLWLEHEIEELKKTHAAQLLHANTIADKLRDELQRTRILLSPGLQAIRPLDQNDDETPPPIEVLSGTPWQRRRAEIMKEDEARWRKAQEQQAALAKGATDGVSGQDGKGPSLSIEGKAV